ncbi:MAG: S8 family serine peptidase [Candidatus Omnitrophota bacterium]|nr:S8 family serine peptidase [Candidatus Omnitrophota bacterium]
MKTKTIQSVAVIALIAMFTFISPSFLCAEEEGDSEVISLPDLQEEPSLTPPLPNSHKDRGTKSEKDATKQQPEYVPGQLIVKLKEGETLETLSELNVKYNVTTTDKVFQDTPNPKATLQQLKDKFAGLDSKEHQGWYWQLDKDSQEYKDYAAKIEKEKQELKAQIEAQEALVTKLEERQNRAPEGMPVPKLDNVYMLNAAGDTNILAMASEYSSNPAVEYAEPNYIRKVQMVPNDPDYASGKLWGLQKIQADKAWDISQGAGTIVAVVDTGTNYNHGDIVDNMWNNAGEIAGNRIDDDRNGFIDDIRGWDFAYGDNDPMDGNGHGTHCSGTIAAVGNNLKGVIGVAPKAKIMAVKGLDDVGSGNDFDLADCIRYAADMGADVISNSWGGEGASLTVELAVSYAYAKGCVVVAAAGNSYSDVAFFMPANIANVIAVAASDKNDIKADFSNYGSKIDVTAPGVGIYSTYLNNGYTLMSGTSMACPHVSGVAALLLSKYPSETNTAIRGRIMASADPLAIDYNGLMGTGRINAYRALAGNNMPYFYILKVYAEESEGDGDKILGANEKIKLAVNIENIWKSAISVTATLSTTSAYISSIINPIFNFGSINSGEIKDNSVNPFIVKAGVFEYEKEIPFILTINADGVVQVLNFSVTFGSRRITDKNSYLVQVIPIIFGDKIVWDDYRNGSLDIYIYDLIANQETRITTNSADQYFPFISGNRIVWEDYRNGNADIYMYDLGIKQEKRITNNISGQYGPVISGNRIVWDDYRNGNYDIYMYDLAVNQEKAIVTNAKDQYSPIISGNKIVWEDYRNGDNNTDIYMRDLVTGTTQQITSNIADQYWPVISGNKIVWEDYRNGNADIYMYDIIANQKTRITTNTDEQCFPFISGNKIVWIDWRNGQEDIYLTELPDTTVPLVPTVTAGIYSGRVDQLSASWSSSDPESGIAEYQYKITQGSPTSTTIIRNWTLVGTAKDITAGGLSLVQGKTYYFSVKAKNYAGLMSAVGYSGGITVANPDLTIFDIYSDAGKLSIKIGNIGKLESPQGQGQLYIYIDGALIWTYGLSTLANQSFRLPAGVTVVQPQVLSGSHKIRAVIDPLNQVIESNENNNTLEKVVVF